VELEEIIKKISKQKSLDIDSLLKLSSLGDRFYDALKIVLSNRVKQYVFKPSERILWVVIGDIDEYIIYPNVPYCTCEDFYFNVLIKRSVPTCKHYLAKLLAEAFSLYEYYELGDEYFDLLIEDWKRVLKV